MINRLNSEKIESEFGLIKARKKTMDNYKLFRLDDPFQNADKKFTVKNSISSIKSDKTKEKEAEIVAIMQDLHNETINTVTPINMSHDIKLSKSIKTDREQKDHAIGIHNSLHPNLDKLCNKLPNKGLKRFYIN